MRLLSGAFVVAGAGLFLASTPSFAASPAYCALFAREYASARIGRPIPADGATAMQRLEDQAFSRCLNLDDEPDFPETSVYYGAPLEDVIGEAEISEGDASAGDETMVDEPAAAPASPPKVKTAAAVSTGSGLKPWSPEWLAWCKANYKSFSTTTGMVLTFSGDKKLCP